ncbi:DUF6586 family protein [Nitrincola tapanii]|uniref:PasA protein n=1 Tax=Nitrincola tapanii TaxID=1708751 RepID=A0A5A9W8M6_9GAMM|nr:DUF6586 family protein [Nitrincola tapanii]KAA0875831.1 hypothetical protein E1H14_03865 [Nitrincola tapanii]
MSELYLARTNQKLNFARLHLDALAQAHASNAWSKHALIESYQESVLFHLASALDSFLREIAERYRFDANALQDMSDLARLFEGSGQESPELTELQALQGDPKSWLARLQKAYAACWRVVAKAPQASASESLSEIHVMQLNPNHAEDPDVFQEYQLWLDALRDLITRQREGMQEW